MSVHIHPTAIVASGARIGDGCRIGPYAQIGEHVVLGEETEVGALAIIEGWTEIGSGCRIFPHAVLGTPPQHARYRGEETYVRIGRNTVIREFVTVHRGTTEGNGATVLGENGFIMAYCHIAHDCQLGNHVTMANGASLAGHVWIEDHVNLGAMTGVHQFVRIGCHAMVGAYSGIGQDVPPYMLVTGIRPRPYGINVIGLRRHNFSPETVRALKQAYRLLYQSNLNTSQALARIEEEVPLLPEVQHLVEFIRSSQRGIAK